MHLFRSKYLCFSRCINYTIGLIGFIVKKLRLYYWITQAFLKKHIKVLVIAALLGAISFSQMPFLIKFLPGGRDVTYVGRVGSYTLTNLPIDIQRKISRGLTDVDQSGRPIADLAENWQVLEDGKVYLFRLKDDVVWQDGDPLLASDVTYNIADVELVVQDEKTLIFKLQEPFSPFPIIVTQPLFKKSRPSGIFRKEKILGTGEFRVVDISFNGNHIDKLILDSGAERLVYNFYPTQQAAVTAFKLAHIDVIEDLTEPSELVAWDSVLVDEVINDNQYVTIFFNTRDPNLSDKSIRQALTYLIPTKPSGPRRAFSPISPGSWAYNPKVKPYEYSLENAKNLIEDKNTNFEMELTTTPAYAQLAESIKNEWLQLGITVQLKVVNVPDTNNFQALLIGQEIPEDPDQYFLWHSTQESNITGYQNAKVDKLLEDGRKELSTEKRKSIYQDFQRFLVEDSPAAFLFHLNNYTVTRK